MLRLTAEQARLVGECLRAGERRQRAHAHVWRRREYAPGLIFSAPFRNVLARVRALYPLHVVALDVVFESAGGLVDWHCDHESLGPFELPSRWRAVRDGHFLTLHLTITPGGGALRTLPWPRLSYATQLVVTRFGLFGWTHRALARLVALVAARHATTHPSTPLLANVFDNLRLHSVAAGGARISYVVRLVRRGAVAVTESSVRRAAALTDDCRPFARLLPQLVREGRLDVGEVDWEGAFRRERGAPASSASSAHGRMTGPDPPVFHRGTT